MPKTRNPGTARKEKPTAIAKGRKRKAPTAETTEKLPKLKKEEENDEHEIKSKYFIQKPASPTCPSLSKERIDSQRFYDKPCLDLAKELIGKILVRKINGVRVSGIIVEAEAYTGADDVASHSYKGRTERNAAMFMDPGTAYVYFIYGSYCCMNISSRGEGAAVLLRALIPLEGLDEMRSRRDKKGKDKPMPVNDFCNGPSKFCMALDISKAAINKVDLINSEDIWLEEGQEVNDCDIVVSTRIGIEGAGAEAAGKPWRFYMRGTKAVSKRDKKAEEG